MAKAKALKPFLDEAAYDAKARAELAAWQTKMQRGPGAWNKATANVQGRINALIPETVHAVITSTIEHMTRGILTGSDWTTSAPLTHATLQEREREVAKCVDIYRKTAAAEGGVAGAGGFLLSAAEFPVLITTKLKMLFDIAGLYGHPSDAFSERLYILSIFQLAFSSPQHRRDVFEAMRDWDARRATLPQSFEGFDWRRFQQQYRDYIDLAKLAQLLPVVGAPIGAVVNYNLLDNLGKTAANAYRIRWFAA